MSFANYIRQPIPRPKLEQLLRMALDGQPQKVIAAEVGVSQPTVSQYLTRAGLGRNKRTRRA